MITIVQLTGSAEWAGGERQLVDLVTHLDPQRFRCVVICPEQGPLLKRLGERGIDARVVELAPLINPIAAFRLAECLKELSPNIVQSHGARSNFYARWVCGRGGWNHVATIHNAIQDYPVSPLRRWLYLQMDRLSARWSKTIVCVSEDLKQSVQKEGIDREKLRVIHNGIDFGKFDPSKTDGHAYRNQWGREHFLVGVVGRMTDQKGHIYLLRALPKMIQRIPSIRAVFVGDGPLRESLKNECERLNIIDRVIFAGVLQDMPAGYAAMDLVALPSVSEGMPYVMLEAMAMGKPVVASAVNGVPEAAENGKEAALIRPRDPEALADAVVSLHSDPPLVRRMVDRGRRRVHREFSLDAMVRRWSELYDEVAGIRSKESPQVMPPRNIGGVKAL